jgi:Thioesterase-like superfamily
MNAAYQLLADGAFNATELTVGPWDATHQHAGPPSALICRAVELASAAQGFSHIGRLTINLMRPALVGACRVEVAPGYVGRSAGHYSGRLSIDGKEVAAFTALAQREQDLPIPGLPAPETLAAPALCPETRMTFNGEDFGYAHLVNLRIAAGQPFRGPSSVWMRLAHPLVEGEAPSPYQRVAVAADSGNGVSAALDIREYLFVNFDLTINLFRKPSGEWIGLQARTLFGGNCCGLAESALYDEAGLIGRATQSLALRKR